MLLSCFAQIVRRLHNQKPLPPPPRRFRHFRPELEALETRNLMSGTWTPVTNLFPVVQNTATQDFPSQMQLLSNGTVMINGQQGGANGVTPNGVSKHWYLFSPSSTGSYVNGTFSYLPDMGLQRLYYGSDVMPNGTFFVVGGEYSGNSGSQNITPTSELYDPVTNTWVNKASYPLNGAFGDDPTSVLPNGNVLGGSIFDARTRAWNPVTNTWVVTGTKLNGDRSDEESWAKMGNGKILSYDVFNSINVGPPGTAQVYDPLTDTWSATGTVPVVLTSSSVPGDGNFFELGPEILLPDGRVFLIGSTPPNNGVNYTGAGHTALYNPVTNSWTAGPDLPDIGYANDDGPAAVLPNGNVIFVADTPAFHAPTHIYEYNPVANTITTVATPAALTNQLNQAGAFVDRMVVLPNGQVLFEDAFNQLWTYSETGAVNNAWRPTISSLTDNGGGSFTLSGTQLNGINEGSYYGDDSQSASNFPIVRLTSTSGVFYARTSNWSNVWVQTGSTLVTTNFNLPTGIPLNHSYSLQVIANGIASNPIFVYLTSSDAPGVSNDVNSATARSGETVALSPVHWNGTTPSLVQGSSSVSDIVQSPTSNLGIPAASSSGGVVQTTQVTTKQTQAQVLIPPSAVVGTSFQSQVSVPTVGGVSAPLLAEPTFTDRSGTYGQISGAAEVQVIPLLPVEVTSSVENFAPSAMLDGAVARDFEIQVSSPMEQAIADAGFADFVPFEFANDQAAPLAVPGVENNNPADFAKIAELALVVGGSWTVFTKQKDDGRQQAALPR